MTDSYYYLEDHTPIPGSEEELSEEDAHGLPPGFFFNRESEEQVRCVCVCVWGASRTCLRED